MTLVWLWFQRAQAVLQAVSAVQDGSSPSSDPGVLDLAPPPSPVLRIIIDNMFYPVTLDVLQQVGGTCCHGDRGTPCDDNLLSW